MKSVSFSPEELEIIEKIKKVAGVTSNEEAVEFALKKVGELFNLIGDDQIKEIQKLPKEVRIYWMYPHHYYYHYESVPVRDDDNLPRWQIYCGDNPPVDDHQGIKYTSGYVELKK